jgi:hypothetical protein
MVEAIGTTRVVSIDGGRMVTVRIPDSPPRVFEVGRPIRPGKTP